MREEGSRPVFVVPRRIIPALYKAVAHTRLPAPTSAGGRNGHAVAPGKGPPSLAASDEPAAVQAHPRCPSPAARGSESRLKDFAHPSPPGPHHRHPWEAEGAGAHDSPPLAGREGDNRHMHKGWLRSDFRPNRSLHHPVSGSPQAHALQAHTHRRPTSRQHFGRRRSDAPTHVRPLHPPCRACSPPARARLPGCSRCPRS